MTSAPRKVLIANRGAIAVRIARSVRALGLHSIALYSEADRASTHIEACDSAVALVGVRARDTYGSIEAVLDAARREGAWAIHPGYGFLAENPAFAEACVAAGIEFLGPTPQTMRAFAAKDAARALAQEVGVPVLAGTELLANVDVALAAAAEIGYPVMLKSTAGGGGIGMRVCADAAELTDVFASVTRLAANNFGDGGVILERYLAAARHVEVQLFGFGDGRVRILGDRDCSLQRRNQKVIEEAPAPAIPDAVRAELHAAARRVAAAARYRSAGTVEFLYDAATARFYFLEVNARLQVEHGVTELVSGVDIVEWMLRLPLGTLAGDLLAESDPAPRGAAIQARVYAEDPGADFRPSVGLVTEARWPQLGQGRVDTWVRAGVDVSAHYDPMLGKVVVAGSDRTEAIAALAAALDDTRIDGVQTNVGWLRGLLELPAFVAAAHHTRTLATVQCHEAVLEVIDAGTFTTVQDWPGRTGYWDIGVPPSGPMDALSFRLANRLLDNPQDAAGLEFTATGPTLVFRSATRVVLTGAEFAATLDGNAVPRWMPFDVPAGGVLAIGPVGAVGIRGYLAVAGGLDVAEYLGSKATFTLGGFGGHAGRALAPGDVLRVGPGPRLRSHRGLPSQLQPVLRDQWTLRVTIGPHAAPDFVTEDGLDALLATNWEVHFQSSRTGVRLIGAKPRWARTDGGDAGLHPSNIHDNAYAIGAVDFTGDMPVILGPDGPSLGGFVCPFVVIAADQWQLGQLRSGDTLRFVTVSHAEALRADAEQAHAIDTLSVPATVPATRRTRVRAVLTARGSGGDSLVVRACGEHHVLIEAGPAELDLRQRYRIELLQRALQAQGLPGVRELTAGVRSLQVHFDPHVLPRSQLLGVIEELTEDTRQDAPQRIEARVVHLPLSWDDPSVREATERYMRVVRADAPWCPSNIEFIRRINGLPSEDAVRRVVFDASYLVLGLGDVYLGAPVATPLDPRHRLVTTKYNPARTWTPENAVGIGGAYLCVYGMEGPGGYQFVGRTIQMWNRFPAGQPPLGRSSRSAHRPGEAAGLWECPWLLRPFDVLRFHPVDAQELGELRAAFPYGRYTPRIESTVFDLAEYEAELAANAAAIAAFRSNQQAAFAEERRRWQEAGEEIATPREARGGSSGADAGSIPAEGVRLVASVAGVVAAVDAAAGASVLSGERVCVIESMKMEIPVASPQSGKLGGVFVQRGDSVHAGQVIGWLVAA